MKNACALFYVANLQLSRVIDFCTQSFLNINLEVNSTNIVICYSGWRLRMCLIVEGFQAAARESCCLYICFFWPEKAAHDNYTKLNRGRLERQPKRSEPRGSFQLSRSQLWRLVPGAAAGQWRSSVRCVVSVVTLAATAYSHPSNRDPLEEKSSVFPQDPR